MITILILCFAFYSMRYVARVAFYALLTAWLRAKHRATCWNTAAVYEKWDGKIWRPV